MNDVSDLCTEWIIKKEPVATMEIMIKITVSEGRVTGGNYSRPF